MTVWPVFFTPTIHAERVDSDSKTPPVLAAHLGEWLFREKADGIELTARHTVLLNPEAVQETLGAKATIAATKSAVRDVLTANSMTTMRHAKAYTGSVS